MWSFSEFRRHEFPLFFPLFSDFFPLRVLSYYGCSFYFLHSIIEAVLKSRTQSFNPNEN